MAEREPPTTAGSLGALAESRQYHEPIDIAGESPAKLTGYLRTMLLIRYAEERIGDMVTAGKIVCPCHLGIGQEAVAAGVTASLRATDRVLGGHRSHSHYLALGGDLDGLMAEVLGKRTGCSRGMGGSMHLLDRAHGFLGSVPIVAGTVPLAAGAALAAKMDGRGDVAVAYFGDGTIEEGAVHETLNFASRFALPLLFVCENNLFSSHLHINLRQPSDSVARFAVAHCMPVEVVDGNDVLAVERSAAGFIARARSGGGPAFIEAVTYRWRGHVGPREDIDVGVDRKVDLVNWKKRDPVKRLTDALLAAHAVTSADLETLSTELRAKVDRAWAAAEAAPYPEPSALLDCVYAA